MATRKAIVHKEEGVAGLATIPIPELRDDYILVKTKAVALNPTDWKSLKSRFTPGAISGCDVSGVVEQVGSAVTNGLKVGDRVAGFVRGAEPNLIDGAFAEYAAVVGNLAIKIAENVSFEEGATLGVGISTVGQGLYQSLGLPLPPQKVKEPTTILIYGGSTATGTLAIQFAKLSGCEVVTTCSPRNFDLCRKLGADKVFNYSEADIGAKIREATNGKITLAFDCHSADVSPAICAAAIGSKGGKYSGLSLKVENFPREDVSVASTLAYTIFGDFTETPEQAAEDLEFGIKFWKLTEGLLNSGELKAHPAEVREGLAGIPQGLQDLKDGKVSGVKLVYTV